MKVVRSRGVEGDQDDIRTFYTSARHAFDAMGKGQLNFAGVEREKIQEYVSQVEAGARAEVEAFFARHNPEGPPPLALSVAEGPPAVVVSAVAHSMGADLVIMATHGISGLAKLLLGSVTEALMRDLDRDILAVPPRGRA